MSLKIIKDVWSKNYKKKKSTLTKFKNNIKILFILLYPLISTSVAFSQDTFLDNFNTVSYSNNNGTMNFASNWVETNEDNCPSGGEIRINSNNAGTGELDWDLGAYVLVVRNTITLTYTVNVDECGEIVNQVEIISASAFDIDSMPNNRG